MTAAEVLNQLENALLYGLVDTRVVSGFSLRWTSLFLFRLTCGVFHDHSWDQKSRGDFADLTDRR
jgi:hypothetical protein